MCLDLVLRNTTDTIFTTNQVKVEIGLKFDDKIEYIPLGIFNISDVKKDDFTTKFTCYDNMFKFDTAYFSKLGDIPTLTQVVNELASITGIQFIGSLPSYTVKKLEGFTCREILSYVASLCGGNALITRDGKFTIIYPTDVNRDIGEGVFDLKRDEVKYKIGKVTCQIKEKETISKGSLGTDSMELQFENPWVTDSILTDIYNRLNGFSYLGYTMKWQGDLSLDVGDIITHIDAKGVNRKLPILNRKLSYDGGLDSELSAKGETKNSNSFNSNGSMKNKVDRVVTEVALINEAFINYAKINDADITNLKAETAKIHNLEVETANINTLLAGNIGSGSIQTIHLTGKNVVIDNAVIKDAMIDTVNANKINTGTLDTNKVTVQGPSGNLLIKDNTIQIKDSTRVRVQIGKDASNDYNMYVWDATGKLMFDATGLKADGIKTPIIRDDMVSSNANINGSKLNISSLITEVNKDNTQTLKASKIAFDSTGQSLEVSFNSLKSNVDSLEIGGRNLLRNSSLEEITFPYTSTEYNWRTASVSESSIVNRSRVLISDCPSFPNGAYGIKFVNTSTTDLNVDIAQDGRVMEHGETYTISAYFKLTKGNPKFALQYGTTPYPAKSFNGSNEWVKCSFTFTYDKTQFSDKLSTNIYFGIRGNSFEGYACGFKLEKGTKATDWTPAQEDIDSKIEANTTSITAVQGEIEGLIKESTITKGDVTTLKDNYTNIKATVDGINTTVAGHTTSIGKLTTDLSGVSGKVTEVETKQATLEQNLNGFKTTVSNTYATKTELGQTTSRVESVEQKVTATAITTTISSAINAGTNSISTTQFVMDKNGLTINNGALTIKNKANANVLTSDTNGNLTITGTFINKNNNGVKAIEINNTNIYFYDWERNGRELGVIYSSYITDYPNVRGFSLAHNQQGYMTLGYRTGTNSFGHYITFDKYAKNPSYAAPIRVHESAVFHNAVNMQDRVYIPNQICFEGAYNSTTPQIFKNTKDSRNLLCVQVSVNAKNDGFMIQSNTGSKLFSIEAGYSYPIILNNNTQVSGNFTVTGSKNSLQKTKHYGERLINAYETAEYYFGDIGFGKINNDGECYISIDDILQECVNLDCEYHIFTQKYNGAITSIDRYRDYFIVYGEPETKFSWQYIAKRIGYENVRLDVPDIGTIEYTPVFTEEDLEVKTTEDTLLDVITFKLEDILMEG